MNGELRLKREKLNKKMIKTYVFYLLGYFVSTQCFYNARDCFLPMMELILLLLKIDENISDVIITLMYYFFWSLPVVSIVFGNVQLRKVAKENFMLKKEEFEYNKLIIFEEQKDLVYELIEKFNGLSRDKQMELLNFVKDDIKNNQGYLYEQISLLEADALNLLQNEMEDILFPSVMLEKDSVLCRKKAK